jgi:7,8-dihydropterin-6-yl-methyl-4-(beta-D-ribofuranosyl)aminobenzene 5'-phosphate synthase
MFVKVLYDNKGRKGFKTGQGFSCLVGGSVLFDTGEEGSPLLDNMSRMKVSLPKIEAVVISHEHWDHTGGLWEVLKKKRKIKVYVCPGFSDTFKACIKELGGEIVEAEEFVQVTDKIYVTGQMGANYKGAFMPEQALVVKDKKGVSVITGCAHPGITRIIKHVQRKFKAKEIYMVFGGFHLSGISRDKIDEIMDEFRKINVKKAGPSHCTGDKVERIFKGKYGKDFIDVKAGSVIEL